MPITTDPNDPRLHEAGPDGQNLAYIVLPDEERAKGFVRPYRDAYKHVGVRPDPKNNTRPLTDEEKNQHAERGYVLYEICPAGSSVVGRFWTEAQLNSGCGTVTTMGRALAETYARSPGYYGSTFCSGCGKHFRVGDGGEFVWHPDGQRVGT